MFDGIRVLLFGKGGQKWYEFRDLTDYCLHLYDLFYYTFVEEVILFIAASYLEQ